MYQIDSEYYSSFVNPDTLLSQLREKTPNNILDSMATFWDKALSLYPRDPIFLHNRAWVHWVQEEKNAAKNAFQKALESAPYHEVILVSSGLFAEYDFNLADAVNFYTRALISSPSVIDSPFYYYLQQRDSVLAQDCLMNAIKQLDSSKDDELLKAKLARLYFYHGDYDNSRAILGAVLPRLPNLNRGWLTLGEIAQRDKDTLYINYYTKSYVLDPYDELPLYHLLQYYADIQNHSMAEEMKQNLLGALKDKRSSYVIRTPHFYAMNIWKNEWYPQELRLYISHSREVIQWANNNTQNHTDN